MSTLLLRLAAPIQSWGNGSRFEIRQTAREPSKSGVIGLVTAAMGISRDDSDGLTELQKLNYGVRVDREGIILQDYHTAKSYRSPRDYLNGKVDDAYVTTRGYLSDAVFLAGLESENEDLMAEIEEAIHHPVFPLFLGRRACPPTLPICLGLRELPLMEALKHEPPLVQGQSSVPLRVMIDVHGPDRGDAVIRDVPVSFRRQKREYGYRGVKEHFIQLEKTEVTEHDAFAEVDHVY